MALADCGCSDNWLRSSDDVRKGYILTGKRLGLTPVTYSVIDDDAIFEGDIKLGTAEQMELTRDQIDSSNRPGDLVEVEADHRRVPLMAGDLPGMVLLTIVGIPWMMLMVRRLHDLNRNGFWSLLVFVPVASFFLFLYLCCFRGTRGRNSYGEDPLGRKADT